MKRIAVVSKSRCPLLLARGVSACLWFFLPLNREGKTVVGAVGKWESRVFCGIPKRSVFSTACWPLLLVGKQAHPVRPVVHTQPSGQMLAHQHPASRQRPAPARALDLQNAIGEADGVVAVDHPLVLQRENTLQLFPTRGHKSALRLCCPHRKLAVEFRNVTLPQEPIGFFSRGDPPQPQLLRQAPLPGPEVSLTPSAGLRRIRGNHRDSQFAQGPPHLGEPLPLMVDRQRLTQVGRALRELGVAMIPAYSPQARGRSKRNFGTWQRRLPQELRLRGITTREEANRFLRESYVAEFNRKFAVRAAQPESAFVPASGKELERIFSLQHERVVNGDNTIRFANRVLQIERTRWRGTLAGCRVLVCQHLAGWLSVYYGPHRVGLFPHQEQGPESCGKDAALGNPAKDAGFPLSHSSNNSLPFSIQGEEKPKASGQTTC